MGRNRGQRRNINCTVTFSYTGSRCDEKYMVNYCSSHGYADLPYYEDEDKTMTTPPLVNPQPAKLQPLNPARRKPRPASPRTPQDLSITSDILRPRIYRDKRRLWFIVYPARDPCVEVIIQDVAMMRILEAI